MYTPYVYVQKATQVRNAVHDRRVRKQFKSLRMFGLYCTPVFPVELNITNFILILNLIFILFVLWYSLGAWT